MLRVGQFLGMLMCMALPHGSLEIHQNCSTGNLPVFNNSAVAPVYPNIITDVPHGTPIQYLCNQGAQEKPGWNTTIVCVNGSWTPDKDPCEVIITVLPSAAATTTTTTTTTTCSTANLPVHSNSAPAPGTNSNAAARNGTSVIYKCDPGSFQKPGAVTTIVCINGFWLPNDDPCERGCAKADLPTFPYSEMEPQNLRNFVPHGTSVRYRCKPGFKENPSAINNVDCVQGSWKDQGDSCHSPPGSVTASGPGSGPGPGPASGPGSGPGPGPGPGNDTDYGVLIIPHAIIVEGKKLRYQPGDRVTVECMPGYILNGKSVLQYSGGNQWWPKIPSCSLSIFISIFVAVIALTTVVLIFLVAYKNFQPSESSRGITMVRYYR